jgi:hypothetical protein
MAGMAFVWIQFQFGSCVTQGCGQRGRLCQWYFVTGLFGIFLLLLPFFLLGAIFAISSKSGDCAFSKMHHGSSLYFVMFDGMLEMWKREGKLCWERTRRLIDDDLAGSFMNKKNGQ